MLTEECEWQILAMFNRALYKPDDPVDGINLIMPILLCRRPDPILRLMMIDDDGVRLMFKNIDGGNDKQNEILRPDSRHGNGYRAHFENYLKIRPVAPVLPSLQTGKIDEQKLFRENKIFLEKTITRKGLTGIGKQRILRRKACRDEGMGRKLQRTAAVQGFHDDPGYTAT